MNHIMIIPFVQSKGSLMSLSLQLSYDTDSASKLNTLPLLLSFLFNPLSHILRSR